MKRAARLAALVLAATTVSAQSAIAKDRPPHEYGPPPTWDQFRAMGEAAVAAHLIDPESARIRWKTGVWKGQYKPFLSARLDGYVACGTVNARNRMGGYAGATWFVVVVDYGRVLMADLDQHENGMISDSCSAAIAKGVAAPLPVSTTPEPEPAVAPQSEHGPTATIAGLLVRAMPEGAYVSGVALGSPASTAGLKPGMVITAVNAIPLAGMGDAMLKVVEAAGTSAVLTLVGGATIKLGASK